jgi:hypothetical protein
MKKVKNILKGYESQFDIEEITIFDTDEQVIYSGSYENFMNTKEDDTILWEKWKRILNSDCEKCLPFNHSKLFIFLHKHECIDCIHKCKTGCEYGYGYICYGKQWRYNSQRK